MCTPILCYQTRRKLCIFLAALLIKAINQGQVVSILCAVHGVSVIYTDKRFCRRDIHKDKRTRGRESRNMNRIDEARGNGDYGRSGNTGRIENDTKQEPRGRP